jgi:hypothetical protein
MLKITKRLQQPFCAALVALMMTATPAQAWTRTGHAAIGFVAEAKLKTDNRAVWNTISELLDGAEFYDEAVAGWADDVRESYPNLIHTVRIPVLGAVPQASDPACIADQPAISCADKAIAYYAGILKNTANPRQQRQEAVKFLLHLVGDLHQPLHGSEPGGAQDKVLIPGGVLNVDANGAATTTDVHSVWDYAIVKKHGLTAIQLGRQLWDDASLAPPTSLTPRDWAVESRNLSKKYIFIDPVTPSANDAYKVPACGGRTGITCPSAAKTLPADYETKNYYLASYRLKQAGFRLAELLVATLGS